MIYYLTGLLMVACIPSLSTLWFLTPCLLLFRFPALRGGLLLFCLGLLVAAVYATWQLHHRMPAGYDGIDLRLSGIVRDLPLVQDHRIRFELDLQQVMSDEPALQRLRRVQLFWYEPEQTIKAGQQIELEARLRSPRGLLNPHGSDRELTFLHNGLDATGYVRQLTAVTQPSGFTLAQLRQQLSDQLRAHFPDGHAGWLLQAVVLGSRLDMEAEHWEVLRRTGTAHLLVVSGLHIGVAAGAGLLMGRFCCLLLMLAGVRSSRLRRLPLLLALLLAALYAALSGFGLPVQRALIMVSIFLLAEWALKPVSGWARWRAALVVIATLQPLALLQAGAWLSFCAVALLLWLAQSWRGNKVTAWRLAAQAQWSIFVGMLPLMALLFNQFGLLAPLVNLLAVPLFSVLIMLLPLLIPLSLAGSELVSAMLAGSLHYFWQGLQWSAALPLGYRELAAPTPSVLILVTLACLWLLMPVPLHWRWVSLFALLPLFYPYKPALEKGDFSAVVFDVGQGLAVLVETRQHYLLYDTGPGYRGGGSAFPFALAPMLRARQVSHLNHLVISHGDFDHAGGYPDLISQLSVGIREGGSLDLLQRGFASCHEHQQWSYDGVMFRYLTPEPLPGWSRNEQSCVLEVRAGDCSLLLPGDAGLPVEFSLVRSGQLRPVTWLVSGHHGSRSSSSEVFVRHLRPEVVIHATGYNNRFGHPHPEVVTRFETAGVSQLNTATQGAIHLRAEGGRCTHFSERETRRRYWHQR